MSGDIVALHRYQALFFAIPKVANSSMKAICADLIRAQLDEHFVARYWSDRWKPGIFRRREARQYLRRTGILLSREELGNYDSYWKFGLVRNPWDRLVSCWRQKIDNAVISSNARRANRVAPSLAGYDAFHPGMSFHDFVCAVAEIPDEDANKHFRSQYTFVADEQGRLVVDYLGRMESLDAELDYIFHKAGIPKQPVPHLLKTEREPYDKYYSQATRDLVAKRFARDIDLFGYSFEASTG
jgi:hypothetical protein